MKVVDVQAWLEYCNIQSLMFTEEEIWVAPSFLMCILIDAETKVSYRFACKVNIHKVIF